MDNRELEHKIEAVCLSFKGNSDTLRNALGVTLMCQQYGWKVIKLIHSTAAWRRYKNTLGIDFEREFPEETRLAEKFVAYKVWKATGRYWDTLRGKVVTPQNKRDIEDPTL